ncbi:FAD dependent oxidoreductase [compost metagenome]
MKAPYPISYRAVVPKEAECTNLIVPICVSATHAAYGSIRMEPVFMILGQSAAAAASLALDGDGIVQHVEYSELQAVLAEEHQVLKVEG